MSLDLEHNAWPSDSAATVISIDAEVIISRTGSKYYRPVYHRCDPARPGCRCAGSSDRRRSPARRGVCHNVSKRAGASHTGASRACGSAGGARCPGSAGRCSKNEGAQCDHHAACRCGQRRCGYLAAVDPCGGPYRACRCRRLAGAAHTRACKRVSGAGPPRGGPAARPGRCRRRRGACRYALRNVSDRYERRGCRAAW